MAGGYGGLGVCHLIWAEQQRILLERFGITWFTPAQITPDACFD